MSVIRINEFRAREDQADALRALLETVVPIVQASTGCIACRLLAHHEEPARLVMLEEWDRVEDHQAAVQSVPPSTFEKAMKLLAEPPSGAYYA